MTSARVPDVAALGVAPAVGVQHHLAVEGGFGGGDAVGDRQVGPHQPLVHTPFDGSAARRRGAHRCPEVQQPRHHPMRRLGGEVIERARRQPCDAVALEGVHAATLLVLPLR